MSLTATAADGPRLFEPGKYWSTPHTVMSCPDLTAADKNVWTVLAGHVRTHGQTAWPSIARMAALTALSRATVIRATARLEEMNWVEAIRTNGQVTHYRILQPEATRGTGRKKQPVSKSARTGRKKQPDPSHFATRCTPRTTPRTTPPHPPADGGRADASLRTSPDRPDPDAAPKAPDPEARAHVQTAVAAEEAAGRDGHGKRAGTPTSAEEAVERIDAAWNAVRGVDAPSAIRRKVRRGWETGDRAWLEMVDAAAVTGGVEMARKAGRTFGLGWVRQYLEGRAASRQAVETTAAARGAMGEQAKRQAEAQAGKDKQAAETEADRRGKWEYLGTADRERFLSQAKAKNPLVKKGPVLERLAMALAWPNDGNERNPGNAN